MTFQYDEDWGRVIERRRQELGLSKVEVTNRTGLSKSTMFKIENGKRSPDELRLGTLHRLLTVLDMTYYQLAQEGGFDVSRIYNNDILKNSDPDGLRVPGFDSLLSYTQHASGLETVMTYHYVDPRQLPTWATRPKKSPSLVQVNPDTMYAMDDEAKFPLGSWLLIETNAEPMLGELAVVCSADEGMAYLARMDPADDNKAIVNRDGDSKLFWAKEYDGKPVGVVRSVQSQPVGALTEEKEEGAT